MTKYVRNDILENIDDPVSVEYEGGWYTPSKQDWDELQNKCTWIWSDKGYTIKGNNGNTIFLPATGYYDAIDGFKGKGDETMYWTNQVSNHSDYESLSYFLSPQEHHFSIVTRWYGLPVRPVIAKTSLAKCDSTILNNNNISKVTNNETLDSTKEYNKVKVIIEADGIIRGIYCDGKYIDFAINANPQLSYSFYTNKGPHLLILESKHKKTKVIVNIKTNNQIINVELKK